MHAQITNQNAGAYNQMQQGKYAGVNAWLKGIEAKNADSSGIPGKSFVGNTMNDLWGFLQKQFGENLTKPSLIPDKPGPSKQPKPKSKGKQLKKNPVPGWSVPGYF